MKKKLLAYVCMIACVFGLTACSGEAELTAYEQTLADAAEQNATAVVSLFNEGLSFDLVPGMELTVEDLHTTEEIKALFGQKYGFMADGNAVATGVQSFQSGLEAIGSITGIGETSVAVKGKQIIVQVQVTGEKKNAVAEVIFSNDAFMTLKSVALNPVSSMGELMVKAALNTVIGMGTVFAVLILISFVISCFKLISKFQESGAKQSETKAAADNAVAQIAAAEEAVDEADDLELAAVIAAAIAASEGAASADGYVVRSIRRRAC